MSLKKILLDQIRVNGPLDMGTYMSMALGHPEFGYYMTRDPLGEKGDFTTAPEVSQMFGELIGAWLADCRIQTGQTSPFALVEFGPGRGTLMSDALRATSKVPGFHDALSLHLVETSPVLKAKQKQALGAYNPQWHDGLESLPSDMPLFCIGNEFLDALPVRQFQKSEDGWFERVIGSNDNDNLSIGLGSQIPDSSMPDHTKNAVNGAIYETAPAREQYLESLFIRIQKQGGAALFIDYGYTRDECVDTLQAVQKHSKCDVLHDPGNADITAHVDFASIEQMARQQGLEYHGPVFQKGFLLQLGIGQRVQMLKANATDKQAKDIDEALERLTGDKQMGTLFKVCAVTSCNKITPAGFAS